jgi:hypothetical protein
MRVLLLPDRPFIERERNMLLRLEVGLADEGVRVVRAVPKEPDSGTSAGDAPLVTSIVVPYADHGLPLTLALRAGALIEAIKKATASEPGARVLDLVHVFGVGAWPMAQRIASKCGAKLMIDVWAGAAIEPAVRLAQSDRSAVLVGADENLAAQLRGQVDPSRVVSAPWGVHVPGVGHDDEKVATGSGMLTCVLLSSGYDAASIKAAIDGLAMLLAGPELGGRGVMIFVDAIAAARQPIWRWASAAGLDGRISVVADLEGRRELALQADVMLLPDAGGVQRSFVLDAMAAGMLIVAKHDPLNSAMIDGRTCRLVREDTPAGWRAALALMIGADHAADDRALGESARAFVRSERLASKHVAQVLAAYDRACAAPLSVLPSS